MIGDRGQILTAFHVVRGADSGSWSAPRAGSSFEAEVIAADPRSDLAVIVPVEQPGHRSRPGSSRSRSATPARLRKGTFLVALGNPFNAARATAGRRRAGDPVEHRPPARAAIDDRPACQRPPQLSNYPDPAPARRQAEPGDERRRGDQPQGRAGRADHHGGEPRGVRRHGRLRHPDGHAGPARRRDPQAGQGSRVRPPRHQARPNGSPTASSRCTPALPGRRGERPGRRRDPRRQRHPGRRLRLA